MNLAKAMQFLAEAIRHSMHACARTRQMVTVAIARLQALLVIQRAAQA